MAETNEELVRAVYDELRRTGPDGLRYGTFVLDDGVSFVHLATVEREDGRNPLTELPAFRRFVESVAERCDEPPVTTEVREVGSYRLGD
jgi:hypothetical protein